MKTRARQSPPRCPIAPNPREESPLVTAGALGLHRIPAMNSLRWTHAIGTWTVASGLALVVASCTDNTNPAVDAGTGGNADAETGGDGGTMEADGGGTTSGRVQHLMRALDMQQSVNERLG